MLLLFAICIQYNPTLAQYPIVIGGFSGNTLIEGFATDSSYNSLVVAKSNDLAIVDSAVDTFIVFYVSVAD